MKLIDQAVLDLLVGTTEPMPARELARAVKVGATEEVSRAIYRLRKSGHILVGAKVKLEGLSGKTVLAYVASDLGREDQARLANARGLVDELCDASEDRATLQAALEAELHQGPALSPEEERIAARERLWGDGDDADPSDEETPKPAPTAAPGRAASPDMPESAPPHWDDIECQVQDIEATEAAHRALHETPEQSPAPELDRELMAFELAPGQPDPALATDVLKIALTLKQRLPLSSRRLREAAMVLRALR